jgi:two-component system sensor histidine kinase UhpB
VLRPLRLLLLEDDEADAALLLHDLRGAGFEPSVQRVETLAALEIALCGGAWDLVIADFHLPSCNGLDALAVVRRSGLDVPFLLISGTVGEETAIAAMKGGAADFLFKHHLAKLGPTIDRELREAASRKAARQAAAQRQESEHRLRLAAELAQLGTYEWDIVNDRIQVDDRLRALLGLPADQPVGTIADALGRIHPEDRERLRGAVDQVRSGDNSEVRQYRVIRPDGIVRWVASKSRVDFDGAGKPVRLFGVLQDIHDLKSAEEELRASSERLQHLSRQLLDAQERERRRIARELHDEIGQGLTAALITLQMVGQKPAAAALAADLHEGAQLLETTLQQVRRMSLELRPAMLDDLGLVPALKWHLDRVGQRTGLRVRLTQSGVPPRVPNEIETVCYRVTQEALTNIVRYARAREVHVEVRREVDAVHLTIADDGAGFDVAAARARADAGGSLGLLSMEERVVLAGGTLAVESAPGKGCRISAHLPLPAAAPSAEMSAEGPQP